MAVSAFVANRSLQYAESALCVANCEDECTRKPDCVGFSSSQLYLRTGGLLATGVSARCGPLERACPTTQIIFEVPEDGAQCLLAGVPVFVAHGVSIAAERRNCTIAVAVRAKQSDAYFSIPRLDTPSDGDSEPTFIPIVVVGTMAAATMGLIIFLRRRQIVH